MNTFVVVEKIRDFCFSKITYYSVRFEDQKLNEFEKFLINHETNESVKDDLQILFLWLEKLGEEIGAQERYFRHEQKAEALPPPTKLIGADTKTDLRLYCMRLNESKVILFNGGVKSAPTAQECLVVGSKFNQANMFARQIEKMINNDDFDWNNIENNEFDV